MNLAALSIRRPSFIMSIVVLTLVAGLLAMNRTSVEFSPDVSMPVIMVSTIYPGAGPSEVESQVSKLLEEHISSIAGLKNAYSISQEGVSIVTAEFSLDTDPKHAEQQVRDVLSEIRNQLPAEVQEPVIKKMDFADYPIFALNLTADLPPMQLYDLAENEIKNRLEQVPNVGKVEIIGGTKREIQVRLDRRQLREFNTSVSAVAAKLAANSQNVPIGKIERGGRDKSFRAIGEFQSLESIGKVVVNFLGSDVPVTVRQLGAIVDGPAETKTIGTLNGKPAMLINVYKQSRANDVQVADRLRKQIDALNAQLKNAPGTPRLKLIMDMSKFVRLNLIDMEDAIGLGILLAIIVVYFFLGNWSSTFITITALPNSMIGAFIFMRLTGISANFYALMALTLAVGLLLDDAIVVRENIYRHLESGEKPETAALRGTNEVTLAVIATTLTIMAVLLPGVFLPGITGIFFKNFGLPIIFAMGISLFDALAVAPLLSAYLLAKTRSQRKPSALRQTLSRLFTAPVRGFGRFQDWLERAYGSLISLTIKHKLLVLFITLLVFLGSLASVSRIPQTMEPEMEYGEFIVSLEAKPGTSLTRMQENADKIDFLLRQQKEIAEVSATVGNANGESNVANLYVKMVPLRQRTVTTSTMKERVRDLLAPFKAELNPAVNNIDAANEGKPFNLLLRGENQDDLVRAAITVMDEFKRIPGLVDLDCNYKTGEPEFQIRMDPARMAAVGVDSIHAGMELRAMVEGTVPATFRENGQEYDIRVCLADGQKDLARDFSSVYVPNMNMQLVKLKHFAEPAVAQGPSKIYRKNRSRCIEITANLGKNAALGGITKIARQMLDQAGLPRGVKYEFSGKSEMLDEINSGITAAVVLSIVFIYLVLVSLYESLLVPFTIMIALPLSVIGGLLALLVTGLSLDVMSMIGFIMLLGLATKNSILMVDFIQQLMRSGLSRDQAIVKAGMTRLRPILMTTFALIAGMIPLAVGLSEISSFRRSMAIAVIGGLISSTFLTLLVIPAIFGYLDRLRIWTRKLFGRPELRKIDVKEGGKAAKIS
ncbi:MAG: efflux RND transporter permease subunit [candidate division FCPU426 bacterium]